MAKYATFSLPETLCFAAVVPEGLAVLVGTACVVEREGWNELCRARTIQDEATCCASQQGPSSRVIRLATAEDLTKTQTNRELEEQVIQVFNDEVAGAPQGVRAVAVRFNLDRSRLLISYHADQRFDARRAAASLNRRYRAVVEARQVGIRDEAAILGGIGSCGRPICCATWLHEFKPVNVRMAKAQDLSLSPNSINGYCGRLKCCLRYEYEGPQDGLEESES